jgi:signal transduction histidine kinase
VVDQSLLIARAEQGREPAERQHFDLAQLLRDATEDFLLIASESDRRVKLKVQPEAVIAFADPAHMRQIIHNLLSNAWKHGRGDIHVRLRLTPRNTSVLAIFNLISPRVPSGSIPLGLGLRVVDTLLGLHPEVKCRRRSGSRYYVVQLEFLRPPADIPVG